MLKMSVSRMYSEETPKKKKKKRKMARVQWYGDCSNRRSAVFEK